MPIDVNSLLPLPPQPWELPEEPQLPAEGGPQLPKAEEEPQTPIPAPAPPPPIVEPDPVADTAAPMLPMQTLPMSLVGSNVGGTFALPGSEAALPFRTPNFGLNRYIGPELIRGPGVPIRGKGRRRPWEDLPGNRRI